MDTKKIMNIVGAVVVAVVAVAVLWGQFRSGGEGQGQAPGSKEGNGQAANEQQAGGFPKYSRAQGVVTVYSSLDESMLKKATDAFTAETGVRVQIATADNATLLATLKGEGKETPADVLLASDVLTLEKAKAEKIISAAVSVALEQVVSDRLRDIDGYWFGLGTRVLGVAHSPTVADASISSYEKLADPSLKGKLLLGSFADSGNKTLAASVLLGAEGDTAKTGAWIKGLVDNAAQAPGGTDAELIQLVQTGKGALAVVSSDAYARALTGNPSLKDTVGFFLPNQGAGVHLAIQGGGLVAGAPNAVDSMKLLEFLAGQKAQAVFAENLYYPVNAAVKASPALPDLKDVQTDVDNLRSFAGKMTAVEELAGQNGWK